MRRRTNSSLREVGEYYGVGAGVGISGFRADLGLCDDLFGNREDAWSNTVRQKRWDWYVDDFGPRLKPGAKRILMNTRWHELDVAGRVIAQIDSGQVKGKVIDIAAIAGEDDPVGRQPGEYLWDDPSGYNYGAYLRSRQRETSPMMWAALFQQKPAPEDGDYFKAEWIKTYDVEPDPKTLRIYGASDFAVTADGGDFTVHGVLGLDPTGRPYLLDMWRKQASSDVWVEVLCDMIKKWKPMEWALEKGQIASGVGPLSRSAPDGTARLLREDSVPDPWRQGGEGAVLPRLYRATRVLCARAGALVCGLASGNARFPCRPQ